MDSKPSTRVDSAELKRRIVAAANLEWTRWNSGGVRREKDPHMQPILTQYWRGVGLPVTAQQLASKAFQASHPWSAAFISWVMRQAGAGGTFRYSSSHSTYIAAAKQNRLQKSNNPFKAYRPSEVRVELGDVVCKARDGSGASYDNIRPGMKTHCDIVIAVARGRATVVGGNVNDSVTRRSLPLDAKGRLASQEHFAVIKVGGGTIPSSGALRPIASRAVKTTASLAPASARSQVAPSPGVASRLGRTHYAAIDLGISDASGRVRPQTGIFAPVGWVPSASVDLVIYLHGIRAPEITIDSYWNASKHPEFALREMIVASGKNVILVAPLLGQRSQSQVGTLGKPGGLDRLVESVLDTLKKSGDVPPQARPGKIALACHSGGGLAMRIIAFASNRLSGAIQECWGFDCTYNRDDFEAWPRWATQRPAARLYLYYIAGSQTQPQALRIERQGLANVQVMRSRTPTHGRVPLTHLPERLVASRFFGSARRPTAMAS